MITIKMVKKNGKITYEDEKSRLAYDIFVSKLPENQKLEMYIDLADADHSKAQLAKVHACIRELATESGYSFDDMKLLIKSASGLESKSFADCSKSELMLAIEACIQIGGENFNINLH
jgi:hypothetical protein